MARNLKSNFVTDALKKMPPAWQKYASASICVQNQVTQFLMTDQAWDAPCYYGLDQYKNFKVCYQNILSQIQKNKQWQQLIVLWHYIFFYAPEDEWRHACAGSVKNDHDEWPMVWVVVLLSGFYLHQKNMSDKDDIQKTYQRRSVREVIWRGLYLYQMGGLSFSGFIWGIHLIRQRLIQVGSLQFEKTIYQDPYFIFQQTKLNEKQKRIIFASDEQKERYVLNPAYELILSPGDKCIGLHIERNVSLTPKDIDQSFLQAPDHIKKYFPNFIHKNIIYRCHSWLLSSELTPFLKPDSHILAFQKRFDLMPRLESDTGSNVMKFLFNHRPDEQDYSSLPDDTSLQKAVKKYILSGKTLYERVGFIFPAQ